LNEPEPLDASRLDIDLMRQIDAVCRRFEAEWRAGARHPLDDYLANVPDKARAALRAELEALERELRPSEETVLRPESSPPTAPKPQAPNPATIAEAATIAPGPQPAPPIPDTSSPAVDEEATLPPRDQATGDFGPSRPAQPDAASPHLIRYFGDYELLREIARGGMGVVYRARQMSLNRPVALKMILAGQLAGEDEIKRFYMEAEAAANLDHPGIVPIYEIGEHEGQHFFSMGFVEGTSLAAKVAGGPLPPNEAAALTMKVAEAVQFAHEKGVIHRDLKPANVLLDAQGQPKVTDFGLAKKLQSDSGLTHTGQVMGTPSYMPPEQAEGKNVGPSADVYALGAILYCLLTGRPPFQAATPMDTLIQVVGQDPVPVRQLNTTVPRDLETICLKCLEKEPRRRYASARALAEELNRFLSGEPIVARPVGAAERAVKWVRRRPVIAALSALVVVTGLLGLSGIIWQWRAAVRARNFADQESQNAKEQANLAEQRRVEAEDRRQEAEQARAKEREQTKLAEQRLYDVQMNFVQHYWEDYNGEHLQQGLDEQLPAKQGGIDRRGFEWFYWQRKMSSGHITLKGHTGFVTSVAYSPDGKRLASASFDQTVKVWDIATGQETLTLKGHTSSVNSVAFSPDGKRLASAGGDWTVKIWDIATGQETLTLKGHTNLVSSVVFSPDGKRIASAGGGDGTVRVWDAATGQETLTLKGHKGVVNSVAFSPDGRRLASACWDSTVKLWDAATGQETLTLNGHTGRVSSVAFSPDGKRIASAGGGDPTVRVWDAATGSETLALKGHTNALSVVFSPDGSRIAAGNNDDSVRVWDAATGQESLTLRGGGSGVAFSPDGKRLASTSFDQTVKVWDIATGQGTLTLKGHTGEVNSVAFSPDGKRLASAGGVLSKPGEVQVWDPESGQEILTFKGHTFGVTCVAFSPDGKRLASASGDQTVRVWDAATGQETLTLKGHKGVVNSVAFSPDGKRLASACGGDQTVRVWDAATGQETLALKGHTNPVTSVVFSPDGKRIASAGGRDATVKVWEAATGHEPLTLKGHTGVVSSVAFSPDGKQLASASWDQTVRVWDAATGQIIRTLKGHTYQVWSVAFSPDGKRLASASFDQTVKVWDIATGQETLTLKGHTGFVLSVAFSPDGTRLASYSEDGAVKLWDARPVDP